MIIGHYIINFLSVAPLKILDDFVVFELLRFALCLGKFIQAFGLKVALTDLIKLHRLGIYVEPILVLQILLDAHTKDVLVHWKLHFGVNYVNFSLLRINDILHLVQAQFVLLFKIFTTCDFLHQSLLIPSTLAPNGLEMFLEIIVKLGQLVLLYHCVLQEV